MPYSQRKHKMKLKDEKALQGNHLQNLFKRCLALYVSIYSVIFTHY